MTSRTFPSRALSGAAIAFALMLGFMSAGCAPQSATVPVAASAKPPVVAIVRDSDPDRAVARAIELIGGLKGIVADGQNVVIKPNCTGLRGGKYFPGQTTDVRVARAVVNNIRAVADCKVTIADGCGGRAMHIFEECGYDQLAKDKGLDQIDLAMDTLVPTKVDGYAYKMYKYPKTMADADVIIDLPVLKTHQLTGIAGGMKNLYGLLPVPRNIYHDRAEEVICDIAEIHNPELIVVDGLIGMEGQGPLWGPPVKMDLVIAGTDIVAVDAVCAAIMGFDPKRVPHLNLAKQAGLGECDLDKIIIKGMPIAEVKRDFKPARWVANVELPKTDKLVSKIVQLADSSREYKDGSGGGKSATFGPERLKVDKKKHPLRESFGFEVGMPNNGDVVRFSARYVVLLHETRPAAFEELKAWIKENLSDVNSAEPVEMPMGAEWHSENSKKKH